MVSLAKSKRVKPDWILTEDWRVMLDYWRTPKAKELSEKSRSARLFNHDGYGPHRHRSGSRSYAKVQDALIQKRVEGVEKLVKLNESTCYSMNFCFSTYLNFLA
ncbi:unnamed protein product [Microthlaspi erraticum]|uniref:Uncharacterized protein n=1 Tax=Microthlaspi erraticum TaxID=1685480 RepID=A0A6D2I4V4_9BRAS|nr:unnamed protein product [Microthlaspi erraticum]